MGVNGEEVGDMRLYQILIADSAYLIWKLKCERVIREETIEVVEIRRR